MPYLIDWTAYRSTFEQQLSNYIGRPVAISGKASLSLLPIPTVSFTDVRIGDNEAPDVQVERFRSEVELAPLLKGEIRIVQVRIERPRLRFDVAALAGDGAGLRKLGWKVDPERVSLGRLQIIGGTAVVEDSRTGHSWQVSDIGAMMEAGSLRGPGRISADFSVAGVPVAAKASFGRFDGSNSGQLKLTLESPVYPVTLSTDGMLTLSGNNGAPPGYQGTATLAGVPPPEDDTETARSPWADLQASGAFELTADGAKIDEAQIAYGALERPLVLTASGQFDFGERPRFDMSVKSRQIDLDRALGQPASIRGALGGLIALLPSLPRPDIDGEVHLDAQGVVLGGGVVQAVGIDVATAPEGWEVRDFAALLPGETRIDASGLLSLSDEPGFRGRGKVHSERPAGFAAWWRGKVGSAAVLDGFAAEAAIDVSAAGQQFRNVVASFAGGTVKGSVELKRFSQSGETFATVEFAADRTDFAQARALAELLAGDAFGSGRVSQLALSLSAEILSAGGIEAHSVVLEGGIENAVLELRRLSIADLAGATVDARGRVQDPFGRPGGSLEASVSAEDISGAAGFLAKLVPGGAFVARLNELAPLLSPFRADISAKRGSPHEPFSLDLTGSFADTHVRLAAAGEGSFDRRESLSGKIDLHIDGEDSAKVLAQLGLQPVPVQAGPLRLKAQFEGPLASGGKVTADAMIAGIDVSYSAESVLKDGRIGFAGDLRSTSSDIDAALLMAGVAVPGLGEGHPASLAGRLDIDTAGLQLALTEASFNGGVVGGWLHAEFAPILSIGGTLDLQSASLPVLAGLAVGSLPVTPERVWADAAFASGLPPGVKLDFTANAEVLDLGLPIMARDAKLDFKLSRDALQIDVAGSELAGGRMKGSVEAKIGGGEVEVAIRSALQAGHIQDLVWRRGNGGPLASGLVDASFDVSGHGRSMAGLVSSLAGTGSFSISDGRLIALNPAALTAAAAVDADAPPDEEKVRETFAIQFGAAGLDFGRASGSFAVSAGLLDLDRLSLEADGTQVLADAKVDLNSFSLSSAWTLRAKDLAAAGQAQPSVDIHFAGPISGPERRIDFAPLFDYLRARYLHRQLKELDELEAARRQAEERRRRWEEEHPAAEPPPANDSDPAALAPLAQPVAPVAVVAPSPDDIAPSIDLGEQPSAGSILTPPDEPGRALDAAAAGLLPMTGIELPDAWTDDGEGSGAYTGATNPDPVEPSDAPAPDAPTSRPARPAAKPAAARNPQRSAVQAAPSEPQPVYKELPNGVIIQVR